MRDLAKARAEKRWTMLKQLRNGELLPDWKARIDALDNVESAAVLAAGMEALPDAAVAVLLMYAVVPPNSPGADWLMHSKELPKLVIKLQPYLIGQ